MRCTILSRALIRTALAALTLAVSVASAGGQESVPVPEGYRLDHYRAPTPASVPGGQAIDTAAAESLWRAGGAIWIDVLPAPRRPPGQGPEAIWMPLPHRTIPGSIWLPDTGRGALSPEMEEWFRSKLDEATASRRDAAVVFFCLADCWMGWNATKRAASYGYSNLYWYREGVDGWENAGLPLEVAMPAAGAP